MDTADHLLHKEGIDDGDNRWAARNWLESRRSGSSVIG
jgi:hypothetical protein